MKDNRFLQRLLLWLATGMTVFGILMLSIRLLITPMFARIEYRMPAFPDDPFGFTLEDRLRWSEPAIKYLVNSEDISYLQSLTFEDGEPLFNDSELSHMVDVKAVITWMRIVLMILSIFLLGAVILAVRLGWREPIIRAFRRSAWGVIGLIAAILLFVAMSFNQLFTWFHMLFFESGTWQFYTSDTLIRLFPMRFWQDAFIYVGILSLMFAVLILIFARGDKV
jgi:integral membrane protein (TIGR01906 family)